MSRRIISLDCETTGLSEFEQEAWEIGYAWVDGDLRKCWQLPLRKPDATQVEALEIGHYSERAHPLQGLAREMISGSSCHPALAATYIAHDLEGATILGAAVQFDLRFVAEFLRYWLGDGQSRPWHHRALDLGSYCAGAKGTPHPSPTQTLADRVPNQAAHTALGDALWNIEVYKAYRELAWLTAP